jgi:lipid A 3-O-deacylase
MRRRVAAVVLAWAGAAEAGDARWYMQIDNDVAWGTDRWYTSGVRIAREHDGIEWGILQEIYTPDGKYWKPGDTDRAPVGRLFLTAAMHKREGNLFQTLEIDAGIRGPSALGEQTTRDVHSVISAPYVDWSRQLGDSPDIQAVGVRTHRLTDNWKVHYGGVLGTQTIFAHGGFEYRFGANSSATSQLLRFAATPPFDNDEHGWSFFAGASVRGVMRNRLLSTNYDLGGPELEKENIIGRTAFGLAYAQRWGTVEFALASDSREFEGQSAHHRFGSLLFHFAF